MNFIYTMLYFFKRLQIYLIKKVSILVTKILLFVNKKKFTIDFFCVVCDANSSKIISTIDRYGLSISTHECKNCGQGKIVPTPNSTFLDYFYSTSLYRALYKGVLFAKPNSNNDNSFEKAEINTSFFVENKLIQQRTATVLDYGCADGTTLIKLKEKFPSINIYGLEPGSNFSKANENHILHIFSSDQELLDSQHKFDIIMSFHVLEHILDPISLLKKLSSLLNPKGFIIIEVPDFGYYRNPVLQKYFHIAHIHHFNKKSLKLIANRLNFEIIFFDSKYTYGKGAIRFMLKKRI